MYPETVAPQDASASTEQSVADVAFATRSKAKAPHERSVDPSSSPVKLFLLRSELGGQGVKILVEHVGRSRRHGVERCRRVKDDDQQQNGVKNASEG